MRGGITGAKTLTHTHTKIHRAATKTLSENQVQSGSHSTTVETHWEDWGDWDRTDQNQIGQDRLRHTGMEWDIRGHTEMDRARPGQTSTDFKGQTGWTGMDWGGLGRTGMYWGGLRRNGADWDVLGWTGTEQQDGTFRDVGEGFVPYGEQRQQVEEECNEGSDQQAASADRHRERAAEDTRVTEKQIT